MRNNIKENRISKAKSKSSSSPRRTREQLANLTKEQRSLIYDRKSPRYKERQREKQKEAIRREFPFRKEISFYLNIKVAPSNISPNVYITPTEQLAYACSNALYFEEASQGEMLALRRTFSPKEPKGYIAAPPNFQKREGRSEDAAYLLAERDWPETNFAPQEGDIAFDNVMTESEFLEFVEIFGKRDAIALLESGLVTVQRSSMKYDDEAQPQFSKPDKNRSNVSAYKPWVEPERPKRDPFVEAKILDDFMQTDDFKNFAALVGHDVAMQNFKNCIKSAVEEKYGKLEKAPEKGRDEL